MRQLDGPLTCRASLIAILATLAWTACAENTPMPDGLIGTYRTTDARYANCYFRLTPESVTIGTGGGQQQQFAVDAVYKEIEGGETTYRIAYRTGYGKDSLSLRDESHEEWVLRSQPAVRWARGED